MTLSIAEALHQAQEAINGGEYDSAAATCGQLVSQFPAFSAAWRTLGEAYREQGHAAEAQRAYAAALQRNYRNPAVYLGLGLLAEEQGIPEHALAFCQVAWELAPQHGHLREPLIRVALRRFGSDGELQYSHAALAQLHANGHRLRRAVDEYRRALVALPDRVDLQLGLAECLWRLGQDAEATTICRSVLENNPEAGQALVILADIEHRTGSTRKGDDYLRRLRAVDPDGALAASMAAINPRADRAWLEVAPLSMPYVSEFLPAAPVERPRIAPAPDFDYQPSRPEVPMPALDDLAPMSLEEFGATSGDALPDMSLPETTAFDEPAAAEADATGDAGELDFASLGITEEPFSLDPFDLPASEQPLDALAAAFDTPFEPAVDPVLETQNALESAVEPMPQSEGAEAAEIDDPFAPFSFEIPATAPFSSFDPFGELVSESAPAAEPTPANAEPTATDRVAASASMPVADEDDVDPSTIDITTLHLPEGIPPTGELTPSEATGLGFEDFSSVGDHSIATEPEPFDVLAASHTAETVVFASEPSYESFDGVDRFDEPGTDSFAPTIELTAQKGDDFDLSSFDELGMELEADVNLSAQPDYPTVPLEARMPEDALNDLTSFASVFDTPVAGQEVDANASQVLGTPIIDDIAVHDLNSLAESLEADVAGALARAGEAVAPVVPDEPVALHDIPTGTGYTTMLASIGEEGLAPFDPRDQDTGGFDMSLPMQDDLLSRPEPVTSHESPAAADVPVAAELDLARITENWDSIDDEILQAMPEGPHHGYTDELRSLSDIGLAPFDVEGEDADALVGITPFDPFAMDPLSGSSDAAAEPLMPIEPFAAPEVAAPVDVQPTMNNVVQQIDAQVPTASNDLAPLGEDDLLSGLQPFSFEEFDGTASPTSGKASIGGLLPASWESGAGASAIPSDDDFAALLSLGDDLDFEADLPGVDITGLSTASLNGITEVDEPLALDPDAFAAAVEAVSDDDVPGTGALQESDLLDMIPGLTAADLDPDIDATIAITRALPSRESVAELPSASDEPSVFSDVSQRLAPGTELFNRARIVKQEMVTEGLIAGDRELEGMDASAPAEDAIDTRHLPETDHPLVDAGAHDSYLDDESDDYDDIISSTGSTRDTTTLRAALEVTPNDDELRWWLAEALRERGDMEQSYAEYRWIIRHAPERHDAVIHSLQSCVERDQEPEMAHRLIGDIYRRRGDVARASNHAALALQVRRRATAAVRAR